MATNLITGGMGFLGTYLARQLLVDGEKVVLFDRKEGLSDSAADLEGRVKIFSGDVANWVNILEAVEKYDVDCIYHTAALLSKDSDANPAAGFRVNIIGTFNILEAARLLGVKDVIYASTALTYGLTDIPTQIYNDTPQKPINMYSTTKVCCERLGEQYHRQYGVNFRGTRVTMLVGPGRPVSPYRADWSAAVIERAAQGKPYTFHASPTSLSSSYIYIKDAAQAMIDLKRAPETKLRQRVYNTHGFMATFTEIVNTIKKYIPDAQITFDWSEGDKTKIVSRGFHFEMDNTTAYEDFGYQPRYLLDEMVKDFINSVR